MNLIYCLLLLATSVAFNSVQASDTSSAAQGTTISPPRGLVSVAKSPAATASFSNAASNHALRFVDAYLALSDINKIEKGERPEKRHYAVVLQPTDDKLRFASPDTFAALVGDMRKSFFGPAEIWHANAYMKAKGEDSKLVDTNGDRILVDETNCFAIVTRGRYEIDGNSKLPPMSLGVAYIRIRGQLFVVKIFAKGDVPEEAEWLTNEIPVWLRSLVVRN
ncbi:MULTISPECIES: hypothetical protein [Rhodanobacter]|nr:MULTISPECIES: hypothetical protein [Rhodanobacter]UJJ50689.1 hypothetical protein LRK52_15835 [Rhodanobacter denitrificans]UJM85984.1 hypothetical protein LRJ86_14510 [Rhodanobacter denitrificans]UJM93403.1 hypothetical protein LRK32_15735 [Rhodanobacter denitrificans]UJM96935.1 hypothetical protein LRK44_15745 [Rhodanobacter denitrificans]UJN20238.1 hypothetical protein LRK54_10895 [Rhodanobacter denitrificans]